MFLAVAFVYWQYIEGCDRETYSRLENEARLKSLGVWAVPGGIQRPWDIWRGRKSSNAGAMRGSTFWTLTIVRKVYPRFHDIPIYFVSTLSCRSGLSDDSTMIMIYT